MQSKDYWRGRFALLEQAAQAGAERCAAEIETMYREAEQAAAADIERWYGRFAANNGLSLSEARKLLTAGQMEEFRWTVRQYIDAAKQAGLSPEWERKLENASARFHISRLESVQLQIQQHAELLFGNQLDALDSHLRDVAASGYTRTAFELQKGLGLGWDIAALDERRLNILLSRPWTADGKTFRDRCWENKANLVSGVQSALTQGLLRGDAPRKTVSAVQKQFGVSRYKAGRLVHTETTYFNACAALEMYKELGVERVEILETLDRHTCEICGGLDGKVLPLAACEPGVTIPPFHPNCRGTTCPYYDDMDGERAARGEDGKVYYVPADMTFAQWKKAFVQGGAKNGLTKTVKNAILNARDVLEEKQDRFNTLKQEYTELNEISFKYYNRPVDSAGQKQWREWEKQFSATDSIERVQQRLIELQKELSDASGELAQARFHLLKVTDSSSFVPASSIKDAEAYCRAVLGVNADYKGLDLRSVNDWNRALTDMKDVFPNLVQNQFGFVGESHQRNALAKQIEYIRQLEWIKKNNVYKWTEEECKSWAQKKASSFVRKYLSIGSGEMASSWSPGPPFDSCRGICMNKGFFGNYDTAASSMVHQVKIAWHPVACSSVKSIFDHEFGHQLDDWLKVGEQPNIQALFDSRTQEEITRDLSEYSWNNHNGNRYSEMIAEGWSEFCNNSSPRPMALEIGETVERLYIEWSKTHF